MNKSIRFNLILFLLFSGYILSSCKAAIFVKSAPTANSTPAPTGTVDPLASPSPDPSAIPQVTVTPSEDDDEFGNITGFVGLVTLVGDHIKIYITLDGNLEFIVREAERTDRSGGDGGSGHEDDDSD